MNVAQGTDNAPKTPDHDGLPFPHGPGESDILALGARES